MSPPTVAPLGQVLLGLLHQAPQSGYDLRCAFAETPLRHFSSSPGAIYPALKRLARADLITGTLDRTHPRRPREVFHLTPAGRAALKRWLGELPTADELGQDVGALVMRFVFIPGVLGRTHALRFLTELERLLTDHLAALERFHAESRATMPLAGRLGLENGIATFATHLAWCRKARHSLRRAPRRES